MATLSSLDDNYVLGQLSTFPPKIDVDGAIDTKFTLYEAANNAETQMVHTLTYNGQYIVVQDASKFPVTGLLKISLKQSGQADVTEIIHYSSRTDTVFNNLVRGFAKTRQSDWPKGTFVSCAVMAEYHNALRDAVLNIENFLGTQDAPAATSINGLLKVYEDKYLSPKPQFRAFPTVGIPPLNVHFQNFSNQDAIRFLWDFGDGTQSIERSPNHIYYKASKYTVKLHIITTSGGQGITTKNNYINVSNIESPPFFYTQLISGRQFLFVDQSEGEISQRYWVFDDNTTAELQTDPNIHTTTHTYINSGSYTPSLLVVYTDQRIKRFYSNTLEVA